MRTIREMSKILSQFTDALNEAKGDPGATAVKAFMDEYASEPYMLKLFKETIRVKKALTELKGSA